VWCKANNRITTKRTLVNWLNRASERTIAVNGDGLSSKAGPVKAEALPEVRDWEARLADSAYRNPNSPFYAEKWSDLPRDIQLRCINEIEK
jgi:hypothetical protein